MMKTSKSILQSQTLFSPTQERDQRKYRLLTKIVGTLTQNFLLLLLLIKTTTLFVVVVATRLSTSRKDNNDDVLTTPEMK
jgi:hypothetical protein